jgi:hypothetical protein
MGSGQGGEGLSGGYEATIRGGPWVGVRLPPKSADIVPEARVTSQFLCVKYLGVGTITPGGPFFNADGVSWKMIKNTGDEHFIRGGGTIGSPGYGSGAKKRGTTHGDRGVRI